MKYTHNYRLREISQILSPERWQELETRAFTRGGCTKPSKDEDQNLALVARALALELPVGMDLWGQLKTMAELVEQCRVYANNASLAKSLSLPTYEAYISAIPDSGKREPYPSVLENMWMLHPNWNGLLLRQFESDKETEMLKAELAALVQPNWAKLRHLAMRHDLKVWIKLREMALKGSVQLDLCTAAVDNAMREAVESGFVGKEWSIELLDGKASWKKQPEGFIDFATKAIQTRYAVDEYNKTVAVPLQKRMQEVPYKGLCLLEKTLRQLTLSAVHDKGLCSAVIGLEPSVGGILSKLMAYWPEHSGHFDFPVPHPSGGLPKDAYNNLRHTCVAYRSKREQLLNWCTGKMAALVEELKPVDKFAEEKQAWEADNRDYHDAQKAWTACYSAGTEIPVPNTGPMWDVSRQYKRNEASVRSLPLKRREVVQRAYLVEVGTYSVREVPTRALSQGFFDLKLVYPTWDAANAAKDGAAKALKER